MPLRRMGRPGLIGMAARTAVVAGTAAAFPANAIVKSIQRHRADKADEKVASEESSKKS